MFQTGKSYKVKVERKPGEVGFGRATVVEKEHGKLLIELKTGREAGALPEPGTQLWFVGDTPANVFNGLWRSTVTGLRTIKGRKVIECKTPRFEQARHRRRSDRLPLAVPVRIIVESGKQLDWTARSRDVSRSGIGLVVAQEHVEEFECGDKITIIIESALGAIPVVCRVIRIDYNWLTSQTAIGLEFWELDPQAATRLDGLLNSLRQSSGTGESNFATGTLSGWMKKTQDSLKIVRPGQPDQSPPADRVRVVDIEDEDDGDQGGAGELPEES